MLHVVLSGRELDLQRIFSRRPYKYESPTTSRTLEAAAQINILIILASRRPRFSSRPHKSQEESYKVTREIGEARTETPQVARLEAARIHAHQIAVYLVV